MLELRDICAAYGDVQILRGVTMGARGGEITCVAGRNGAGKSTLMKAIMGLVTRSGSVQLDGEELAKHPAHMIPKAGIALVPQGRRLFTELTVAENLTIGLMTRNKDKATREHVLDLFPRLRERLGQIAGTLSGGEQQMLAIGRALCIEPKVLLLDEPSEGLQPSMVELVKETCIRLRDEGLAVVLVEQRLATIRALADQTIVLENGSVKSILGKNDLQSTAEQLEHALSVTA